MSGKTSTTLVPVSAPDGGWGWVVVFSSLMIHLLADGVIYTFGIFYVELLEYFGESKSTTSLVASILVGTTLCLGPLASGLTNKFGCRVVSILGALLASLGLFLSAFASRIEHLFITIGLVTGSGLGLMCVPSIVSVSCYFEKRRATATGLAVSGSGLGTFILAPIVDCLVQKYGWQGAIIIVSGMMLNCVVFSALYRPLNIDFMKNDNKDVYDSSKNINSSDACKRYPTHSFKDSGNCKSSNVQLSCLPHCLDETSKRDFVVKCTISVNSLDCSSQDGVPEFNTSRRQSEVVTTHRIVTYRRNTVGSLSCNINPRSPNEAGLLYHKDILYSGSVVEIPNSIMQDRITVDSLFKPHKLYFKEIQDVFSDMLDFSLLKNPLFLLFATSNFLLSVGCNVPYVYTADRVEEQGITDREKASLLLSVIGISNTIGRVVFCYLADRTSRSKLFYFTLCLIVNGLATILSSLAVNYYLMAAYCAVFGATIGACISMVSIILVELLGMNKLTNAFGLLLLFVGVSSFIGPPITGWLYELMDSYNPGFYLSGGVIVLSGLILFPIPLIKKTYVADSNI